MRIKPKVAIITPGSFPIPSSRSSSVETVIEMQTNILQNDIQFTVFGKKTKDLPSVEKQGNISYVRVTYRHWTRYLSNVMTKLSKLNPDIIQIENRPKYIPLIRHRFQNALIFLSLHSTMFISKAHIEKEALIRNLHQADKIIVNSHFLKDYLIKLTDCDANKVIVNYLGVDTTQFQSKWSLNQISNKEKFIKQMNLEGRKIILFVGRLRKIKGIHIILQAMPSIIQAVPNTLLLIAGSAFYGSERRTSYVDKLFTLAKNFPEHVRFVSFISHEEIHHWFKAADLVLVPSIGHEAFGLVNVEAMACGVPVIATKIGGMPEVIEHGRTGYLINLQNIEVELSTCVIQLLNNPKKVELLGLNSVERVMEHFTWEKSSNRILQLYIEMITDKK
ncbi:glycosyltransferase family 4 protein [Neobacillus drentensis]|uniref:glycosyltransferase family 4 protein n=1 Tax=Neobacillus drentensis TaxID=220684 RepID=UPI00082CB545|nr:glycosyltransferase family 4 protein [Neobacillus drentensis]